MSPKTRENENIIKTEEENVKEHLIVILVSGTSLNNMHTDSMGTFFSPSKL